MCPFNSPFCLWRPNQNGGMFFCTIGCQKQTATANAQKQQLDVDLKVNPKFLKPKIESRGVFFFFFWADSDLYKRGWRCAFWLFWLLEYPTDKSTISTQVFVDMHQTGIFSAWVLLFKTKTFSKCVSKPPLLFPFSCFRLKVATYVSCYTVSLQIATPSNQLECKVRKAQNVKQSLN